MKYLIFLFLSLMSLIGFSQPTFPFNGVLPKDVTSVALTHATIWVDYQTRMDDATLIIEKGKVVAVGSRLTIPTNAVVIDVQGKFIYPSFIDLFSDYGLTGTLPAQGADQHGMNRPPASAGEKGAFGWNAAIHSHVDAVDLFSYRDESARELRAAGFGTVVTHRQDGIVRGSGALVALSDNPNIAVIRPQVAAFYSFNKGSSSNPYPSSLMGSIALLRQTYYDMLWYKDGGAKEERNISLEEMSSIQTLPAIFDAGEKWNILRADKVGDEFGVQYIIKTSGNEYQRMREVKASKASLIVPLIFPDAYDVTDPFVSRLVSIEEMKHWEMAPSNCAMLAKEQIPFAITSNGLSDKTTFLRNLRKSVSRGLSEADAIKALTYTPAVFMNADKEIGRLQTGMWANFMITSKNIFEDGAIIHENWVQGKQYVIDEAKKIDLAGQYQLRLPLHTYELKVRSDAGKLKAEIQHIMKSAKEGKSMDTLTYSVNIIMTNELLTVSFEPKDEFYTGVLRMAGDIHVERQDWQGKGQDANGVWFDWSCTKTGPNTTKSEDKKNVVTSPEVLGNVVYPFTAYGFEKIPERETVLIRNATIWTCDKQGKIENGQVLISNGKIVAVGNNLDVSGYPDRKEIDAKGKHVSPGIIDEHSHIALASVNEGTQACSAEVDEATVLTPEDINIYRQLSGGVTCAQLLHGSANPIGGQSALVKLHWGGNADDMLIDNAPKFIKFALGENVKQSNWSNDGTRFPQSRMGVEQIYYDHFIRAREYAKARNEASTTGVTKSKKGSVSQSALVRRDLEMDALSEILQKERFVTCHSYVQSEINMLMHVADSMNFTLNTFTHILEGYKVADKMKAHGAGASSFSDWWAYKYEVKDAIPYNGALLWEQGITVAFNSDDAEMARRLNQEAAKAVKYGGVPEEEALKFVTLNPAKLLHIDSRTGSLAAGKDADVVIWSDHPLSIYAVAEQTFVDGIRYFDKDADLQMRKKMEADRSRLIQKMLTAKSAGEPTQQPSMKDKKHFHCDTMDETSKGVSFK